ncbi:MAG TPA: hypothetical protein VKZ53_15955 [Candidatus Angelobacter sp.]|nr:hypothetical protein [Candidatus Angelobacter sp.]
MRIKVKLNYLHLLVPVLLLAGVQMFAQVVADNGKATAGPAVYKATTSNTEVPQTSDRLSIRKSVEALALGLSSDDPTSNSVLSGEAAKGSLVNHCPIPECAAPPPGCSYQGPPTLGSNGCPTNCGTLVCNPGDLN